MTGVWSGLTNVTRPHDYVDSARRPTGSSFRLAPAPLRASVETVCGEMTNLETRTLQWAAPSKRRQRRVGRVIRAMGPFLPWTSPPREPVFIIGAPRSGTTVLFDTLDRSASLASLGRESGVLWDMFHRIEDSDWVSHEVPPDSITDRERRVLYWALERVAGKRRYLDKLPRNCLRVPYLHRLFPDAWFIFICRDGRATVSSMLEGWRSGARFSATGLELPVNLSIAGYEGATWKFLMPQGWREFASGKTLAEVCAFQWMAANEAILAARSEIGTDRWLEVRYESLVESPVETSERLLKELGLPLDDQVRHYAAALDRHVSKAVSAPYAGKWMRDVAEIDPILPQIRPMMERLGYRHM